MRLVEVDVVAIGERTADHGTRTANERHGDDRARPFAQRVLRAGASWGLVVLWIALEIRWRWHRAKARIDLP